MLKFKKIAGIFIVWIFLTVSISSAANYYQTGDLFDISSLTEKPNTEILKSSIEDDENLTIHNDIFSTYKFSGLIEYVEKKDSFLGSDKILITTSLGEIQLHPDSSYSFNFLYNNISNNCDFVIDLVDDEHSFISSVKNCRGI